MRSSDTTFRGAVHRPPTHEARIVPQNASVRTEGTGGVHRAVQPVRHDGTKWNGIGPSSPPPAAPVTSAPRTDAEILERQKASKCCAFAGSGFVYKAVYMPSREEFVAHGMSEARYDAWIEAYKKSLDRMR